MTKVDVTHVLVFEYPHELYKGLHRDKLDAMFDWCIANDADLDWEYIFSESRFSPQEHFFNFKDGVATMFALKFN
jgi:hypothetical protein